MNVSRANPYSKQSTDLVKKYENGLILDDGAGYPRDKFHFPNVIQMKIVPYPTTDVIGEGRKLPFKNDCFDDVLSHVVLEHVPDPFAYVSEIFRVLKQGVVGAGRGKMLLESKGDDKKSRKLLVESILALSAPHIHDPLMDQSLE